MSVRRRVFFSAPAAVLDDKVISAEEVCEEETRDFSKRSSLAKRGKHSKSVNSSVGACIDYCINANYDLVFRCHDKLHSTCRLNFDGVWVENDKFGCKSGDGI